MAYGPLLFGGLLALGVMLAFAALAAGCRRSDPVEARLEQYGVGRGARGGRGKRPGRAPGASGRWSAGCSTASAWGRGWRAA